MKKVAFFLALMMGLACASSALAGSQDFTLVNASSSNLCFLYISPQSSNDWESDVLGEDQCLSPGQSIHVTFNSGSQAMWDLRVEDENGNHEDYSGFNLNEISEITIKGNGEASHR